MKLFDDIALDFGKATHVQPNLAFARKISLTGGDGIELMQNWTAFTMWQLSAIRSSATLGQSRSLLWIWITQNDVVSFRNNLKIIRLLRSFNPILWYKYGTDLEKRWNNNADPR